MTVQAAKNALARVAVSSLGSYFRLFPKAAGNGMLYDRVVMRHLSWRAFPIEVRTKFGARLLVNTADVIGRCICFFGVWEPSVSDYIAGALKPGDIFIDVGANIGYYTVLAAKRVGDTGRVYAIEASPTISRTLARNVAANTLSNVVLENVAVVAEAGPIPIYLHDTSNVGHSTVIASVAGQEHRLEATVEGLPLVDIVPADALRQARLVKIDVEGAEWLVLQGLKGALGTLPDRCEVLMEINARAVAETGGSVEAIIAAFRDAGFSPFEIENTYQVEEYITTRPRVIKPLTDLGFTQADVIFRRIGQTQ